VTLKLCLLVALTCAAYAPAQIIDTVEMLGVGGTFPLPIYSKWFEEYGKLHRGAHFRYLAWVQGKAPAKLPTERLTSAAAMYP
jgi:ABC-type phosphate transport system substrate-binding protein